MGFVSSSGGCSLAGHNTFIAVTACYWEVFLLKQIFQLTKKVVSVKSTTGYAAKVFKHKPRTIRFISWILVLPTNLEWYVVCLHAPFSLAGF